MAASSAARAPERGATRAISEPPPTIPTRSLTMPTPQILLGCCRCRETKPLADFGCRGTLHCRRSGQRWPLITCCKECVLDQRETRRIQKKRRERAGRREYNLKKHHGWSPADYARVLAFQGGGCAICGKTEGVMEGDGHGQRIHLDHDHATDENRGILCSACNNLLKLAQDSPERLQKAIDYLVNPPCRQLGLR